MRWVRSSAKTKGRPRLSNISPAAPPLTVAVSSLPCPAPASMWAFGPQGEARFLVRFEWEVQQVARGERAGLRAAGQVDFVLGTGRAEFALPDRRDAGAEVNEAVAFKNLRGSAFIHG